MKNKVLNRYKRLIPSKRYRLMILSFFKFVPDSLMLRFQYILKLGTLPNFKNPKRFSEKIQCYKMFYRNDLMQICSDKLKVRKFVESKGLSSILNKLYGTYTTSDKIPFNELPRKCVIKTTNSSKTNIFYNSEMDISSIKSKLDIWLKENLFIPSREWSYKFSEPKIIIEKFLEDKKNNFHGINDYKFFCFQGKVEYVVLDVDREKNHKRNFYDKDWNYLEIVTDYPNFGDSVKKPSQFNEMIKIANTLSKDFPFVRVDLYLIESKIIFGELTFYPWSGFIGFHPDEFDFQLGNKFILPKN